MKPRLLLRAFPAALRKLDPRLLWHNPVMFVVEVGSVLSSAFLFTEWSLFGALLVGWLWLTVLFANLAEAVAEGRGKAQAESLRRARKETTARRLRPDGSEEAVPATELRPGDRCLVGAGEVIPSDGEVLEGVAAV
ncbi:MAG: K+-transporting ATPase, subunit, partial [Actinobacteria bacterium]|nr:K+-transporting ATPase, subunit [Actinomycetota bacterium]